MPAPRKIPAENEAFSKVFRERSSCHRVEDPEILLQRRAHQRGERSMTGLQGAAADQDRQSEPPMLSCRLGEALEGKRANRIRHTRDVLSRASAESTTIAPGRTSEGSVGVRPPTNSADRISKPAKTGIETR